MRNQAPSTRRLRRAVERHGERILHPGVGKHGPGFKVLSDDTLKFHWGGRTPPKGKGFKDRRQIVQKGLLKIRKLWLRAGVLAVPYGEAELKELIERAKHEFDTKGMVSINTSLELQAGGIDVERVEEMWRLMGAAKVNWDGIDDHPDLVNNDDNDEEQTNVED